MTKIREALAKFYNKIEAALGKTVDTCVNSTLGMIQSVFSDPRKALVYAVSAAFLVDVLTAGSLGTTEFAIREAKDAIEIVVNAAKDGGGYLIGLGAILLLAFKK